MNISTKYEIECTTAEPKEENKCSMNLTGPVSLEAGETGVYTAKITTDGTVTKNVLTAPNFTPASTSVAAKTATVTLTAPTTAGTYTLTAKGTLKNGNTCSDNLKVTTLIAASVAANAYESATLDCSADMVVAGEAELMNADTSTLVGTQILADGAAVFNRVANGNYLLAVKPDDSGLFPLACGVYPQPRSVAVISNEDIVANFYFTRKRDPWWQVVGGDMYAANVTGIATPPEQTLMANGEGTLNTSGAVIAAGKIDTTTVNLGPSGRQWKVENSAYAMPNREDFVYFSRLLGLGISPTVSEIDDWNNPPEVEMETNEKIFYVNNSIEIPSNWIIADNKARTIFVDGDLTIDGDILVNRGSFLAFIVKGNINIQGTASAVQGVYISNETVTIADGPGSGDGSFRQAEIQGTLVGWKGVALERDLDGEGSVDDLANNQFPAVEVIYRPDFLINAPDKFKHASMQWREVAP